MNPCTKTAKNEHGPKSTESNRTSEVVGWSSHGETHFSLCCVVCCGLLMFSFVTGMTRMSGEKIKLLKSNLCHVSRCILSPRGPRDVSKGYGSSWTWCWVCVQSLCAWQQLFAIRRTGESGEEEEEVGGHGEGGEEKTPLWKLRKLQYCNGFHLVL